MADEGASAKELVIEAARRNNTELLQEIISKTSDEKTLSNILNTSKDPLGNSILHIAAQNGNYDILDLILDQEGVEIDVVDRIEKDSPLHKAVRYCNTLDKIDWEHGKQIVDILIDAGCDPRIRNKAKLKPIELVDPRNTDLKSFLQKAEYTIQVGDDVIIENHNNDEEEDYASESD